VSRSIGRLTLTETCPSSVETTQDRSGMQLTQREATSFSEMECVALDQGFADAVHITVTPFSQFTHQAWREFFAMLSAQSSPPSPKKISTIFIAHYRVMWSIRLELAPAPAVTIGVDGATKVHSRTMNNAITFDRGRGSWNICDQAVQPPGCSATRMFSHRMIYQVSVAVHRRTSGASVPLSVFRMNNSCSISSVVSRRNSRRSVSRSKRTFSSSDSDSNSSSSVSRSYSSSRSR